MKCDRCREQLPAVDGIDQDGQTLCLECAMRGFSAVRACDPWVVQHAELSQDAKIRARKSDDEIW